VSITDGHETLSPWTAALREIAAAGPVTSDQLARQLTALIGNRQLAPGSVLPTSVQLEQLTSIPRGTFVRARRLLLAAALLQRAPAGWVVAEIYQR
jgi:DNA-binding GntR family transcriptional regulator